MRRITASDLVLRLHVQVVEDARDDVVAHAASLEDTAAAGDLLWPGIAARVCRCRGRVTVRLAFSVEADLSGARRFSFTLAAGWLSRRWRSCCCLVGSCRGGAGPAIRGASIECRPERPTRPEHRCMRTRGVTDALRGRSQTIRRRTRGGATRLDPARPCGGSRRTSASMDRSRSTVRRRALAAIPSTLYLNRHLAAARQRKLALLRQGECACDRRLRQEFAG